jgi:ComF family protein
MHVFIIRFSRYFYQGITTIYRCIFAVLYAPICQHCRTFLSQRSLFCTVCWRRITPVVSHTLSLTKTCNLTVFAVTDYNTPLKSLVQAKRAYNVVASYHLAECIWRYSNFKNQEIDYLVPIPLHWYRRVRRGFNQAQEIAKGLSKKSGVPVVSLLKRVRNTPYQTECSYVQRGDNVKDAFTLTVNSGHQYTGKRLMLVDDVMTSGSTLYWAAHALLPLKPHSLAAVVACRTLRR